MFSNDPVKTLDKIITIPNSVHAVPSSVECLTIQCCKEIDYKKINKSHTIFSGKIKIDNKK